MSDRFIFRWLAVLLPALCAAAADPSQDLLEAAAKGQTPRARALLGRGASIEVRGKNGRTPLMLAAQRGHADVVRVLLEGGAHAEARDDSGWNAYGLTVFEPAGHGDHAAVLKLLPPMPAPRLAVEGRMDPVKLLSSCFFDRAGLASHVQDFRLDALARDLFRRFAEGSGKGLVEVVKRDEPAVANLTIDVAPGAACSGQGDELTLVIGIRLARGRDQAVLLEKVFGGGLKGLRAQAVSNPAQYEPVYKAWIEPEAGPIYWAVASALYRAEL